MSQVQARPADQVDPRGQRFAASLTAVLLAVALVAAPSALTVVLLVLQLAVFFLGGWAGPARTPKALHRPRPPPPRRAPPGSSWPPPSCRWAPW